MEVAKVASGRDWRNGRAIYKTEQPLMRLCLDWWDINGENVYVLTSVYGGVRKIISLTLLNFRIPDAAWQTSLQSRLYNDIQG